MSIKLYLVKRSPPARAVLVTAAAIGLKLDTIFIEPEYLRSKEFLMLNPQHTVPVLVDGDTIICDSHAIMTYLIGKYAKDDSLYPKDLIERSVVDQRLYYDASVIFVTAINIVGSLVMKKFKEIPKDLLDKVMEIYDILEQHLSKTEWIAGNHTTVADFSCYMTITGLRELIPYDAKKLTKLKSWMTRVAEIPYLSIDKEYHQAFLEEHQTLMSELR